VKSPTADVTWQKGAKRQMANLDRFIEEMHLFEKANLTVEHIDTINGVIGRVQFAAHVSSSETSCWSSAVETLHKWVTRVLQ
jgi:dynein heavy chain, axonemal